MHGHFIWSVVPILYPYRNNVLFVVSYYNFLKIARQYNVHIPMSAHPKLLYKNVMNSRENNDSSIIFVIIKL